MLSIVALGLACVMHAQQVAYAIAPSGLKLRGSCDLKSKTLYSFKYNEVFTVLDTMEQVQIGCNDNYWLKVRNKSDLVGYVFGGYVSNVVFPPKGANCESGWKLDCLSQKYKFKVGNYEFDYGEEDMESNYTYEQIDISNFTLSKAIILINALYDVKLSECPIIKNGRVDFYDKSVDTKFTIIQFRNGVRIKIEENITNHVPTKTAPQNKDR